MSPSEIECSSFAELPILSTEIVCSIASYLFFSWLYHAVSNAQRGKLGVQMILSFALLPPNGCLADGHTCIEIMVRPYGCLGWLMATTCIYTSSSTGAVGFDD